MDAIHDIFCKFAADTEILGEVTNIKLYLFKSLKYRLYDIYKTQKTHVDLSKVNASEEIPFNIQITIEDTLIDTENKQLIKNQIEEMLDSLTERQREIIYLRYIQEYDYHQIAELLNISIHGCRKLVSKAMINLREKYGSLLILFLLY